MPRLRLTGLRSALAGPVDLTLEPGECAAVMGPSGAGKSLFLRMVADLDPHEGEAWVDEQPRRTMPPPLWRRRVALCAAESGWWAEGVGEHFADPAAARALLPRLGLSPGLLDGPIGRLSTGEKHRMALARTLLLASPVLLLDEPTGALDEASTALVEALVAERLAQGTAILLVTHLPAQAQRLASRVLAMAAGRLA